MELDQQTKSGVWWKGAISSALKGIPQGLMLGLIGFAVLTGGIYLFGATSLVGTFGSFLFGSTAAATEAIAAGSIGSFIGALNPLTFVALNTVLTLVGNFLTGGDMAVAKHQQEVDHAKNEVRIRAIEGREKQMEHIVARHLTHDHQPQTTPQHVQQILSEGPRVRVEKPREEHAADIVADRLESAERTLH
jgi:hypothetical protein